MPSLRYRRAPAGGYQYRCRREGDECRDEACRRAGCHSVSHFSCRLPFPLWDAVFFLLIVPLGVSGVQRAVAVSRAVFACAVWRYADWADTGCRVLRFASVSSHLIASFRFRSVSSFRLITTRAAIRFARYGRREEDRVLFDYSYVQRFLNNFVLFFNPASIWWNIRPASFFHIS